MAIIGRALPEWFSQKETSTQGRRKTIKSGSLRFIETPSSERIVGLWKKNQRERRRPKTQNSAPCKGEKAEALGGIRRWGERATLVKRLHELRGGGNGVKEKEK